MRGEGRISRTAGGRAPALPIFGDSLLFMHFYLTQNYQIWCVNTYGEELVLVGQPNVHHKEAGPSAPQFWGFLL